MNCVQCGEALPASAKFCKKCGCKVAAAVPAASTAPAASLASSPAATPAASPITGASASPAAATVATPVASSAQAPAAARGLPAAPTAAYSTCPDCGALCKGDARFCNKCGCRFEEAPNFEDTRRDLKTPLSPQEEKAILVFGNVQDSNAPAPDRHGERIDTSPAMVIGGSTAGTVAAPPSLRAAEPASAELDQDWLKSGKTEPSSSKAASAAGLAAAVGTLAAGQAAGTTSAAPAPVQPRASGNNAPRNPMPTAPAASGGSGKWVALGVVALAAVVGGGAWWWNTQGKFKTGPQTAGTPSAAPAPAAPAAPAVVAAPAPAPAALPADAALAPNETMEPAKPAVPAMPEVNAPAPAPAVVEAPAAAAAPAEAAAPKPAPRKPARKQTLDDLLN
ncbi:zinc ribbon domain-containing protein [Comamonas sp. J-3]|uniref:double zinc ribbon domain-containing protein n=1 Tax=Comamonas trifloxystrobinivorans TaxID=3350256 RepID=UPI003726838C